MEHIFIVNPTAGKGRKNDLLNEKLAAFPHPHRRIDTTGQGHAQQIAHELATSATPENPLRLYVCGGDGTLNEVVNGVAGHPNVAITNVPTGTGNDFLKLFSPNWRDSFWDLDALAEGATLTCDLIDCNGRLALDMVCAGVDARVGADVDKYKKMAGSGAYVLALIEQVFFRGITRPMNVTMGDIHHDGNTTLLCVSNGRHYGGGFCPIPEAMPDDGILDALLIGDISLLTLLRLVKKYATGRYKELPNYITPFHGDQISLSAKDPITVVVDGEKMEDTHFKIALSSQKIQFFYPSHMNYQPILP